LHSAAAKATALADEIAVVHDRVRVLIAEYDKSAYSL
jgi:hypothetical protein